MAQPKPPGSPPKWAVNIPELSELRERRSATQNYLYERPATSGCIGVTVMSYMYQPQQKTWYWSPYTWEEVQVYDERRWIHVSTERIPRDLFLNPKWVSAKPTEHNLTIMRYLAQHNPDPTGGAAPGGGADMSRPLSELLRIKSLGHLEPVLINNGFQSVGALKAIAADNGEFMRVMQSIGVSSVGDRAELYACLSSL